MVGDDWIEHRRADGELVGWIVPRGEGFVVLDLLGCERTGSVDWLTAENSLDELGIGYLADPYLLTLDDGRELRVRIVEVSAERIVVKKDDFGAVGAPQLYYDVVFPVSDGLRVLGLEESHILPDERALGS